MYKEPLNPDDVKETKKVTKKKEEEEEKEEEEVMAEINLFLNDRGDTLPKKSTKSGPSVQSKPTSKETAEVNAPAKPKPRKGKKKPSINKPAEKGDDEPLVVAVSNKGDSSDPVNRLRMVKTLDLSEFRRDTMSITEGQYLYFMDKDQLQLGVYCFTNGEAVAFYDTDTEGKMPYTVAQLRKFAAAVVSSSCEANYMYGTQTDVEVSLQQAQNADLPSDICKDLQERVEKAKEDYDRDMASYYEAIDNMKELKAKKKWPPTRSEPIQPKISLPEFQKSHEPLYCFEREPLRLTGPKSDLVVCTGCAESYHTDCVASEVDKKTRDLKCCVCTVDINGVQWGNGSISMTCTMDNILTAMVYQEAESGNFILNMPEDTPAEKAYKKSVQYASKGDDANAHIHIYKYLKSLGPDCPILQADIDNKSTWGNPRMVCYDLLIKDAYKQVKTCTDGCSQHGTTVEAHIQMQPDHDYAMAIELLQQDQAVHPYACSECHQPEFRSKITFAPGRLPIVLPINFDWTYISARDAAEKLPREIKIENETFDLGMITLSQTSRGHFMALLLVENGHWVAYDGLHNHNNLKTNHPKNKHRETKHFRLPFSSDWNLPHSRVYTAEYFRRTTSYEKNREPTKRTK